MDIVNRVFIAPQRSYFLFGARGSGKSTMLEEMYDGTRSIWINLLQPDIERRYATRPERLNEIIQANPTKKIIVIDEVQRVPALLPVVHALIFERKDLLFVLTGSSARKIKRSGSDLLAGRASQRMLHSFMAVELGDDFSLENALQNGLLPLLYQEADPKDVLQTYISLYLKEEVKMEGLVRNVDNFSRFLEVISFSHGSLLNVSNIARECAVKRKTVENYVEILEDLLLSFRIPIFNRRAQRELSVHPKFYIFDVGVYKALRPRGPLDTTSEIDGSALEGLIAQHLRAWCDYSRDSHQLFFWRTRSGVEVDFIVYGEKGFWAIEVKNKERVDRNDVRSLKAFLQDYPMAKAVLVYRGRERISKDGVLCLPAEEFLLNLMPNKSILVEGE